MSLGGGASRFLGEGVISLQDPQTHHRTQIVRKFFENSTHRPRHGSVSAGLSGKNQKKTVRFYGGGFAK